MAEADRRAIAGGTPESLLVERAGGAVARRARRMLGGTYGRRVVVVCGKGNNGADGRVAARVLESWGARVATFAIPDLDRDSFARATARADLFVDAMFGTGFRGELEGPAAWVADHVRRAGQATLAIDIPSGVDGSTGAADGVAVHATETVCFVAAKPGLLFEPGRSLAGSLRVVDIGIDPGPTTTWVPELADLRLPVRDATAHKWSSGLMVFGCSVGLTGAPLMVSHAGARCGAGMVVCCLPGLEAARAAGGSEIVTRALPSTPEGNMDEDAARVALKDMSRFRALAI